MFEVKRLLSSLNLDQGPILEIGKSWVNSKSNFLVTHLAVERIRVVCGLDEPAAEAVVVDGAHVALAVARLDHRAQVRRVGVVADPALRTTQVIL